MVIYWIRLGMSSYSWAVFAKTQAACGSTILRVKTISRAGFNTPPVSKIVTTNGSLVHEGPLGSSGPSHSQSAHRRTVASHFHGRAGCCYLAHHAHLHMIGQHTHEHPAARALHFDNKTDAFTGQHERLFEQGFVF